MTEMDGNGIGTSKHVGTGFQHSLKNAKPLENVLDFRLVKDFLGQDAQVLNEQGQYKVSVSWPSPSHMTSSMWSNPLSLQID